MNVASNVAPYRNALLLGVIIPGVFVFKTFMAPVGFEPNPRTTGWHTSRVVGSPEPPAPYSVQMVFPGISFETPIEMLHDKPSDTYVVAQQDGKIFAFENQPDATKSRLLLDVKNEEDFLENLWGVALHPRQDEMPFLYAYYGGGEKLRLSRFPINLHGEKPAKQDEQVLLEFTTYGHMGGALIFGPGEYLYLAIGDGTGASDGFGTGQDISDLYASVVRLNVNTTNGEPYSVPADNPFLDHPGAQPEVWAYGVRQVWKMSYDAESGKVYGGDVGQDLWEALYQIESGGNYGWSINESGHPFRTDRKLGPSPIIPPVVSHAHYEMRSITAGHMYRGTRLAELQSHFIYGGYDSGTIWGIDSESDEPKARLLADTSLRISCFGRNLQTGEVFAVDHASGRVFEIVPNTNQTNPEDFPHLLSETGLFTSVKDQIPADGIVPLEVNSPLWSDGAIKKRFLAVPGNAQIDFEKIDYLAFDEPGWRGWEFPDGTVLVKTFYLNVQTDEGVQLQPVETRLMQLESLDSVEGHWYAGNQVWRGYSYRWNDDLDDAVLVPSKGLDVHYTTVSEDGVAGSQTWRYPSRSECTSCHTQAASFTLSANTAQLNRSIASHDSQVNQLEWLNDLGAFENPVSADSLAVQLPDPRDETVNLEARAKSYLHANCSHCHRPFGGGNSPMDLRYHVPLEEMSLVGSRALHGDLGMKEPQVVRAGNAEQSVLYRRMMSLDGMRMPKVGSHRIDKFGTGLIRDWIEQLEVK